MTPPHYPKLPHLDPPPNRPSRQPPHCPSLNPPPSPLPEPTPPSRLPDPPPSNALPPPPPKGPSAHFYWGGGGRVQKQGDGPPVIFNRFPGQNWVTPTKWIPRY